MSAKKPTGQERRLGGGVVLLSNPAPFTSTHMFKLYQPYTLGEQAFYVEPGLLADALYPLKLKRMQDISQLQFLTTVGVGRYTLGTRNPHVFSHNRLIHNARAAALHGVIGLACGLEQNILERGILLDDMHDNFTCAGGDSWKDINHQGTLFDEDEDFAGKIFNYCRNGWNHLCYKYKWQPKTTAKLMQEIINGQGLSGEIHEIADTASYMLGDLEEIRKLDGSFGNAEDFAEVLAVAKRPWHIWNSVAEKDGHLVVTDPIAFNNFLLLRVLLWAKLYQNPARKVLEVLMQKIVYPWLVSRKIIKISDLPTRGDSWLFTIVERQMGWETGQSRNLNLFSPMLPQLRAFATWGDALAFEEEKYRSGAFTLVYSVKDFQKTKSKTDKYRVFTSDGRVDTFKAVYANHAAVIDQIAADTMAPRLPVQVVFVDHPTMSNNFRQAWQEARSRWVKRTD